MLAHLSGLPVRRRRQSRSPGKASAATGESIRSLGRYGFPGAVLRTCPGYRSADGGEPVAPVRRQPPPGEHLKPR
ncbi:hypothetical protein FML27_04470 [Klebsiella grimontii]|nr:hypothetical protein [Klebsiella grimontii]